MQGGERWPQAQATNPSARLRAARVMPQWITARGSTIPPPPPPPINNPSPQEPEYEVIEFSGQQTYSNQPIIRGKEMRDREKKRCDLCGSSAPAIKCMQCTQQNFCYSCDEMYHRHPKRQSHIRKQELEGAGLPPLPPKGEPQPPPVPPPRRNKRATPRPQHSPLPPTIPPSPQISQREQMAPKPGFMGSLKRMMGNRQLPIVPHGIGMQNHLPTNNPVIGFHDPIGRCSGFQDWSSSQRVARSGSFNNLNPPGFGQMMQAQSAAHLNCPSCQGHNMWNPWSGMPAPGTWQSSAFLNHCPPKQEWSDSDSDSGWHQERQRRFSTISARTPKGYKFNDTQSMRGGRRTDVESSSYKGNHRKDFDTIPNYRGSRRRDSDTMSMRGDERRIDIENSLNRSQRKFSDGPNRRYVDDRSDRNIQDTESSEKESDNDIILSKDHRRIMSDVEDIRGSQKISEPIITKQMKSEQSRFLKSHTKNNELAETSPTKNKISSMSSPNENGYKIRHGDDSEAEMNKKAINGVEIVDAEEEEDLGPIPDTEWECKHCTFVNQGGTRVCSVCCKTTANPKVCKPSTPMAPPTEEFKKKLKVDESSTNATSLKKTKELKDKRGNQNPEPNRMLTSKGTSPPPQSISTQTYEEGGRKLKRATSLADYGDWRAPQRSVSRQSLLSDTQSLPVTPPRSRSPEIKKFDINRRAPDQSRQRNSKRAGSQPPEHISSLVQKQVKQGLEMVKLLREAEEHQFSAEDLSVALLHCGDGDPINWLQENWRNMIDTVVTLGTNYGQERKENIVGTISASEARDALRAHDGNVWAAVTECVEQRQKKYAELLSRGNFSREDIVTVLTANHGNLEEAYKELNKNQLKPFLMRIWGPPQGADNDDGDITKLAHGEKDGRGGKNSEEVSVDLSIESNYDRIQNWLDHVNVNNKFSQSLLQLNLTGSNRSESEWRFQTKNRSSDFNKNTPFPDVHTYLTNLYNANEKSLKLDRKTMYSSVQNLHTGVNPIPDSKSLYEQEKKSEKIAHNSNKERNDRYLEKEMESITIQLKPIVIQAEEDTESSQKENNDQKETTSFLSDFSEDIKMQEKSINESDNDLNHNNFPPLTISETSVISNNSLYQKLELSRSNSETTNESFESLHSGSNEDQIIYENMPLMNLETRSSSSIKINEIITINQIETTIEQKIDDKILNNEFNVIEAKCKTKILPEEPNDLKSQYILNGPSLSSVNLPQQIRADSTTEETIESNNQSLETHSDDDEIKSSGTQELVIHSTALSDLEHETVLHYRKNESSDVSEDGSNFISTEILPYKMEYNENTIINIQQGNADEVKNIFISSEFEKYDENKNENNNSLKYLNITSENTLPNGIKGLNSKSNSAVNVEGNNEFSEESGDYKEENFLPSKTFKREQECHISDANSDKDVSSIQTDSDQEILPGFIDNDLPNKIENIGQKHNTFHSNQEELIDLLKKSLTKDEVVEKIVSTLFASVLQVSVQNQNSEGLTIFQNPANNVLEETEEIVVNTSVNINENISRSSSVSRDEIETNVKQEIIIPTLSLAEKEDLSDNMSTEPEDDNRPEYPDTGNKFSESDEPKVILFQREARRLLAEGLVTTYKQAEVALQLKELSLDDDDEIILTAANECDSLESAMAFLHQECQLCAGKCSMKQMVSMLECEHKCCLDCASNYFTLQITERNINDCTCPFCKEPDIIQMDEDKILTYFSNLDIFLKGIVQENIHELFQRKLRDRTLMQDPNFKWCVKCSSGYISNPRQKRLMCPDCKAISCAKCMKPWEKEHEKMSCEEYKVWLEHNDPDNQLNQHLDENGVTCPHCKSKYLLAKGGCMHLICPHCKHEFCAGCSKPFLMGRKCTVSEYCEKLGLHSHHPRNCLFYLRDKEPEELEKLLEDNNVNFKNEEFIDTKRCNIQLLKETPEGLLEGICGYATVKAGLCRTHYVESLVTAIRNNRVDPVMLLDYGEALQELRRHGKDPPERTTGMLEYQHRQICLKIIEDEIPLD